MAVEDGLDSCIQSQGSGRRADGGLREDCGSWTERGNCSVTTNH